MYDVNVSKGINGGFIVTVSSTVVRTQVIKYKITATIDLYDSLNEMIYSGNPDNYTIVINGVSYTDFTTIAQVVDKLELLFNVDAIGRPIAIPDKLEFKIASANVRNTHAALVETVSTTYEKLKTITFMNPLLGVQRFIFTLATSKSTVHAHAVLKHNGVIIGTEQTSSDEGAEIVTVEATPTAAGSGYSEGDTLTVHDTTGFGDDATVTVVTTTKGITTAINPTPPAAGSGYLPNDVLTLSTGGGNAQVTVLSIAATGGLQTLTIAAGGTGFAEGANVLTVIQGGASLGTINAVASAEGIITSLGTVVTKGSGYSVANGLETSGGTGVGCVLNLTVINGAVVAYDPAIVAGGTGYVVGAKATTGGTGTGATCEITTVDGVTGAVTVVALGLHGGNYTTGAGKATTGGTGTGCTVEISAIGTYDTIVSQDLTNYFQAGDTLELWLKTDGAAVASAKTLQVAYDTIGTDVIYGVNS